MIYTAFKLLYSHHICGDVHVLSRPVTTKSTINASNAIKMSSVGVGAGGASCGWMPFRLVQNSEKQIWFSFSSLTAEKYRLSSFKLFGVSEELTYCKWWYSAWQHTDNKPLPRHAILVHPPSIPCVDCFACIDCVLCGDPSRHQMV